MKISKRHLLNYSILVPYILLSVLGLIVVYSTTSASLIQEGKSAFQLVRNQGLFWVVSLLLIAVIYKLKALRALDVTPLNRSPDVPDNSLFQARNDCKEVS